MKVHLRGKRCGFSNALRSSSQIFGLHLVERAMASSTISTKSQCLLVCLLFTSKFQSLTDKDYRIPQMLHSLGMMWYCPPLENHMRRLDMIESGHSWEMQIRGCSIWGVELLRREILLLKPDAKVNAILIDFFLYDLAKEKEANDADVIPHHRTRSIWY